jgi:hypothetical protein
MYSRASVNTFYNSFLFAPRANKKGGSRPGGLRFHQLHQLKTILAIAWGSLVFDLVDQVGILQHWGLGFKYNYIS